MAPGYIRPHGRVQATDVRWDDDHGQADADGLAVSSSPEAVGLVHPWRRWIRDEYGHWLAADDYARPNAVTVLQVAVPLAGVPLPDPRYHHGLPDTTAAKHAVRAICITPNAALACVFAFDPLEAVPR